MFEKSGSSTRTGLELERVQQPKVQNLELEARSEELKQKESDTRILSKCKVEAFCQAKLTFGICNCQFTRPE